MQVFDFEALNPEWVTTASRETIENLLPKEAQTKAIVPIEQHYKGEIILLSSFTETGPWGQCRTLYVVSGLEPTVTTAATIQGIHPLVLAVVYVHVEPVEVNGRRLLKVVIGAPRTLGPLAGEAPAVYFRVK
ncbi:MAG: hypothetical protein WA082_03915 [Candidatus Moraniibacteriota bacterium]